jgi:hypothetical protein
MLSYFQRLGERIERAWLLHNYNEEIFPQLALGELEREPPHEQVAVREIIDWTFDPIEVQQPSRGHLFGEPPVMLFQAPRFYIEALFWLSGTTEIHEHAFSGVFAVLAGSSVHSHWRFVPERTINSRMLCGRLERVATEILCPGGMRVIQSGGRLIHQLFHLEVPSVTIVVRTNVERNRLPQLGYLPPGLALDPDDQDGLLTRRLVFLEGMARGELDGLREHALKMIETGDLEALFRMFSMLTRRRVDRALLDELYDRARQRHGEAVDLLRQACEGERRIRVVRALRSRVSDPEARFLLALLMLMPDRDAVFETIRCQYPDAEPLELIERWLAGVWQKETIGFELSDLNRHLFRGLVEGLDADSLVRRLQAEHAGDPLAADRDRLLAHAKSFARSALFHPLFSHSPLREERDA